MNTLRLRRLGLDRLLISTFTALLTWGVVETARADPYQLPLLGASPVAPNVIFTLDDSGSMLSPLMPDNIASDKADGSCCNVQTMAAEEVISQYVYSGNERAHGVIPTRMPNRPSTEYLADAVRRSSQRNTIYYNPDERYEPWTNSDGTPRAYPTASSTNNWASVPVDPASALRANFTPRSMGSTTNATSNTTKWCLTIGNCNSLTSYNGGSAELNAAADYDPTVYYVLDNASSPTNSGTVRVSIWNMKEYRRNSQGNTVSTNVSAFTRGAKRTDCSLSDGVRSCSRAQELQNFGTWYVYHRTRLMLAKASVSKAFASPDIAGFRLGWGALNNLDESNQSISVDGGASIKTLRQGVRNYTPSHRDAFYSWLFDKDANAGTPLRRAVDDIGKYYTREDNRGPWADEPGTSNSQTVASFASCRRAFHILTTDGYWGSSSADAAGTSGATADVEAAAGPTITGANNQSYQYKPGDASNTGYKDGAANMLADVAMYYWNRDLAPNMVNNISPGKNNEAFWQHMVNYTVGLGVSGRLNNPGDLSAIKAGTKRWQPSGTTATSADDASKADDLWHAAYNSRGQNLNAANSSQFAASLQSILTDIASESNKTAGVGVTGSILGTGSAKYVPEYTARDWTGDLKKFSLSVNTGSSADEATWSAAEALPEHGERNIYIGTGADTKLFRLASFNSAMLSDIGTTPAVDADLINYLRGDDSNEGTSAGKYRVRASRLGDIVNSTPLYVKGTLDYQYNLLTGTPAAGSYRSFVSDMRKREALVYAGANDGMLHVFADDNGAEVFAYIPRAAVGNLSKLADQNYGHRFYVDGAPAEVHAYWGDDWKSVVLSTLGAGGKGLFAINATNPALLKNKTNAGDQVLWELNGLTTPEIGFIFGDVDTGPIKHSGSTKWVALVGNGVSSSSNKAQLLVVDISNGQILQTIDTGRGSGSSPNGLGGVRAVRNAQGMIVAAYAGDVLGNVWRFDLNETATWKVAFGGQPLYATSSNGGAQPFTASPSVISHPRGGNLVVISSGKLIDEADRPGVSTAGSQLQTIYGLWDTKPASLSAPQAADTIALKTSLRAQTINTAPAATNDGRNYYSISSNVPDWKVHRGWYLNMTLGTGQRVIYPGQLYQGKVLIGSVIPTTSTSCSTATSFNFLLDALTGNANNQVLLDTNGDGILDNRDAVTSVYSTGNDGRDRIVVRDRQTVESEDPTPTPPPDLCTPAQPQNCSCPRGSQIISATSQTSQCAAGGTLAGSRTWRILNNPPRPGAQ